MKKKYFRVFLEKKVKWKHFRNFSFYRSKHFLKQKEVPHVFIWHLPFFKLSRKFNQRIIWKCILCWCKKWKLYPALSIMFSFCLLLMGKSVILGFCTVIQGKLGSCCPHLFPWNNMIRSSLPYPDTKQLPSTQFTCFPSNHYGSSNS